MSRMSRVNASNAKRAAQIAVGACDVPGCNCHQVTIALLDAGGHAFALGSVRPAVARSLAEDLIRYADLQEAQINKRILS